VTFVVCDMHSTVVVLLLAPAVVPGRSDTSCHRRQVILRDA
jgi:hypothetical protein